MSVNTYFNYEGSQASVCHIPPSTTAGADKSALKAQIQTSDVYAGARQTVQKERAEEAKELFFDIMSRNFVAVNEQVLGYLDILSLLKFRLTSKAMCQSVNYFLFEQSVFYDCSIPRDELHITDIKAIGQELERYSEVTYSIPCESKEALEAFAVRICAENIFQYIFFKTVCYEEGTTDPIDQHASGMEVSLEIAGRLVKRLMACGLMEIFTKNPFDQTAYTQMKGPLKLSVEKVSLFMREVIAFVREDEKLSLFLEQGKRFDHAKTGKKLAQRLEGILAQWERLASPMARCRVVYGVIEQLVRCKNRSIHFPLGTNVTETMRWIHNLQGYLLSNRTNAPVF